MKIENASPLPRGGNDGTARDAKLRDATQQFEAFFAGHLLKQMRKGVGEGGGLFKPSPGEKMFRDMMDDETARSIGKTRQFGIADLLYDQLAPTLQTKRETP